MAEEREVRVNSHRVLVPGIGPPKVCRNFFWAAFGSEVQLDLGFTDFTEARDMVLRAKQSGEEEVSIPVYISDRFLLNPLAAQELYRAMGDVVKYLKQYGLLPGGDDATT